MHRSLTRVKKLLQFVETARRIMIREVIIVNPVDAAADACHQIVDAAERHESGIC